MGHAALSLLNEQGVELDAGEPLLLRRTLKSDGGSRAFIAASAIAAGLLREVGALLVEVHGQHDDRGLLNPRGHRELLDTYGKLEVGDVSAAWFKVTPSRRAVSRPRAACP